MCLIFLVTVTQSRMLMSTPYSAENHLLPASSLRLDVLNWQASMQDYHDTMLRCQMDTGNCWL